jgi:ribonuclease HI
MLSFVVLTTLDPRAIQIYTDGSCYKNPGGMSGAAAIAAFPDHLDLQIEQIVDFGCAESNNNRMELLACIRAIEWVRKNKPWPGVQRVQIISDSRYVVDNLGRAIFWRKQGWRNVHGEPKKNSDLWNELLSIRAKAGIRIDFYQQTGKSTEILKNVDKAAKLAAKRGGLQSDTGFKSGKVFRSHLKTAATIFPAAVQITVIFIYRKDSPIKTENQIRFDVYDEATKTYPSKHFAYTTDSLALELHRGHWYRVKFNDTPKNPRIEMIVEEVFPT